MGFPKLYDLFLTSFDNTSWVFVGTYSNQPAPNGMVNIPLATAYPTKGVLIQPRSLGLDSSDGHYFQLSEIQLAQ